MVNKKFTALILVFFMLVSFQPLVLAYENQLDETSEYVYKAVDSPTIGSIGGEWAVIGLARSNYKLPDEYFNTYLENVYKVVKENEGVLSRTKFTEYSRVIIALSALGINATNVNGYNFVEKLSDFDNIKKQGINGPIFALLALDSGNYQTSIDRQILIDYILNREIDGGGFSLDDKVANADITAMVVQALSKYKNQDKVKIVLDRSVEKLSEMQLASGGFSDKDEENAESIAQVITALSILGIDCETDQRFIKVDEDGNKNTPISALLRYYINGGGFSHTIGTELNQMATEQALCAMVAYDRLKDNKKPFYDMSDVVYKNDVVDEIPKEDEVVNVNTFIDMENHWARDQVIALANKDIIKGKSLNKFEPDMEITRAEFATIIVKALGLKESKIDIFDDIKQNDWYYGFVSSAVENSLVKGKSEISFAPNDFITREEAVVITYRAMNLISTDIKLYEGEELNILSQFIDYKNCSEWSKSAFAISVKNGLISEENIEIRPKDNITRAEAAVIVARLLDIKKVI